MIITIATGADHRPVLMRPAPPGDERDRLATPEAPHDATPQSIRRREPSDLSRRTFPVR